MPITINGNGAISGLGDIDGHDLETATLVVSGDTTIAPQAVGRATLFVDDSTNSVGINTTTPAAAVFLEVADGTDPIVSLNNTGNGEVRLGCTATAGYIGTESNHPFEIQINSSPAVSVLTNGNVGIGVTSPADKLEVLGDVRLIPPSGPNTLINFEYNNGTFAQIRGNGRNSNPLYGDIEFWTKNGGDAAPVERLVVRAEGRVGINTATPSRTFDVESNVGEVATYFKRNVTGSSDTAQGVSVFSVSDATRTTGEGFGPSINFEHRDNVTAYAGAQISSEREVDGNRSDLVFYSRRYGYQETFRATADQALQLSANCLGIDFSLIAGSSSGSVTSNTLDDYEEGTWTPILLTSSTPFTSITYDPITGGVYTKIGNLVYLQGIIRTDAISGGSGNVRLGGFPFTVGPDRSGVSGSGPLILYSGQSFAVNVPTGGEALSGNTFGGLTYRTNANGNTTALQVSDLGTGTDANLFRFFVMYQV